MLERESLAKAHEPTTHAPFVSPSIGPGDLQWMVAGKGIMHAEVSDLFATYHPWGPLILSRFQMPLHEEGKPDPMGLQLWIDLPAKDKGIDPLYQEMLAKE